MPTNFESAIQTGKFAGLTRIGNIEQEVAVLSGIVVNVKDSRFAGGAKIDGTTVDTNAFSAAILAAGQVLVPAGTAIIDARLNAAGRATWGMSGVGRDSTTLKAATNTNANLIQGSPRTTFSDFTVDGNKANQSSGNGVQLGSLSTLRNLRILNATGLGIQAFAESDSLIQGVDVESSGSDAISLNASVRMRVIGCRVDSAGGVGLSNAGNGCNLNTYVANVVHNTNNIGIAGGGGSPASARLVIAANVVDGTVVSHGIDLGNSNDVAVVGNAIYNCAGVFSSDTGGRQLWVGNVANTTTGTSAALGFGWSVVGGPANTATYLSNNTYLYVGNMITNVNASGGGTDGVRGDVVVSSNIFKNSGLNHASSHDGFGFGSTGNPSGNILVIGNKSFDDQNVKTQEYGLNIGANTYHVYAVHNDLRGNKLGAILDNGVANYTHGNPGYNPRGWLTAPAPAASNTILYNPFNVDCMVYINGSSAAALTAVAVGGINKPVNATHVALTTGGTLAAATYFYRVSALNPNGETVASTETSIATTGSTGSVLVRWTAVPGATGYNVYGRTTGAELKIATNVQATTFLDDGSITPSGALPGADTTGNTAITGWTAAPGTGGPVGIYLPWGNGIKLTYTTFVTANWQWFGL